METLHRRRQRLARDVHRRAVLLPRPRVRSAIDNQGVELHKGTVVREHSATGVVRRLPVLGDALHGAEWCGASVEEVISHETHR